MGQLSMFSAETDEPSLDDLAGILASAGQVAIGPRGARLSVVVADDWRARALADEIERCGVAAEISLSSEGSPLVGTTATPVLEGLYRQWTKGAVKTMPATWVPTPRALRLWVMAAGQRDADRYLLGLDAHAPDSHGSLATAVMRAGIAPTLVGTRSSSPALRIAGKRRLTRLIESVGEAPDIPGAALQWPFI
ncbi:hypothetical protein BH683_025830 [Williamsia sp. 1138]|uniref:hypothetical protein n=1 Tax=Williamsia sp. 1138 TaxID=1903117 RepID=UPI000A11906D|nr:hypothetical protein [Williamsia sp. 1138]OZG26225.1 hypothetical protein BH683_025830 [Williamsia sp. 1138]